MYLLGENMGYTISFRRVPTYITITHVLINHYSHTMTQLAPLMNSRVWVDHRIQPFIITRHKRLRYFILKHCGAPTSRPSHPHSSDFYCGATSKLNMMVKSEMSYWMDFHEGWVSSPGALILMTKNRITLHTRNTSMATRLLSWNIKIPVESLSGAMFDPESGCRLHFSVDKDSLVCVWAEVWQVDGWSACVTHKLRGRCGGGGGHSSFNNSSHRSREQGVSDWIAVPLLSLSCFHRESRQTVG